MTKIVFEPWIGARFTEGDAKLLLIGESHYGDFYGLPALATQYAVEQWRNRAWRPRPRYFLAASRLLNKLPAHKIDEDTALENISFYNFIQVMMPTIKNRPTKLHFRESQDAFREVLQKIKPTHILVTGKKVWDGLPCSDVERASSISINLGGEQIEVRRYCSPSGITLATFIPHLSRGFSPPRWEKAIDEFCTLNASNQVISSSVL